MVKTDALYDQVVLSSPKGLKFKSIYIKDGGAEAPQPLEHN